MEFSIVEWNIQKSRIAMDGTGIIEIYHLLCHFLQGRNGKGSIFVWANGNGGIDDDCAADGYTSSIYTISVGAIGVDGKPSSYDEECTAKMVVTYVTDMHGKSTVVSYFHKAMATNFTLSFQSTTALDEGCSSCTESCTTRFGGTSAATPLASGIIALALEAK